MVSSVCVRGFPPLVVLDTTVLVAAIKSRRGASFAVLDRVGRGLFDVVVSVPLVVEYEHAMVRERGALSEVAVRDIIDYLCQVAVRQPIFFLWRPLLRDPADDMVAEAGFAAGAEAIITHNRRDFVGVESLGLAVLSPRVLEEDTTMSTLSLRLPESIHLRLAEVAAREGVSIDQLVGFRGSRENVRATHGGIPGAASKAWNPGTIRRGAQEDPRRRAGDIRPHRHPTIAARRPTTVAAGEPAPRLRRTRTRR